MGVFQGSLHFYNVGVVEISELENSAVDSASITLNVLFPCTEGNREKRQTRF